MSDPETESANDAGALEPLEKDAEAMDRPDRAIPLPDGEEDEGVGEVSSLVP